MESMRSVHEFELKLLASLKFNYGAMNKEVVEVAREAQRLMNKLRIDGPKLNEKEFKQTVEQFVKEAKKVIDYTEKKYGQSFSLYGDRLSNERLEKKIKEEYDKTVNGYGKLVKATTDFDQKMAAQREAARDKEKQMAQKHSYEMGELTKKGENLKRAEVEKTQRALRKQNATIRQNELKEAQQRREELKREIDRTTTYLNNNRGNFNKGQIQALEASLNDAQTRWTTIGDRIYGKGASRIGYTNLSNINRELSETIQNIKHVSKSVASEMNKGAQSISNSYRSAKRAINEVISAQRELNAISSGERKGNRSDLQAQYALQQERLAYARSLYNANYSAFQQGMLQPGMDTTANRLRENELKRLAQTYLELNRLGREHSTILGRMKGYVAEWKDNLSQTLRYYVLWGSVMGVFNKLSEAVQTIKDLDTVFTQIKMVAPEAVKAQGGVEGLAKSYSKLAKEVGSTTQEVAAGAVEWMRQGKSIEETNELLKASMTLATVGGIDSATSTELMTSTLNGYKMLSSQAMDVVDKISAIDMAAATSSEEIMTALARTANSANDAGVSFDRLISMIATVSEVTRKSASTIRRII